MSQSLSAPVTGQLIALPVTISCRVNEYSVICRVRHQLNREAFKVKHRARTHKRARGGVPFTEKTCPLHDDRP